MSYITLTQQYKENLKKKIIRYIKDELLGVEMEFDQMFKIDVECQGAGMDTVTWICTGINEDGMLTGRDHIGDYVDYDVEGLDIETLSYMLDQLLEVNYTVVENEVS